MMLSIFKMHKGHFYILFVECLDLSCFLTDIVILLLLSFKDSSYILDSSALSVI